MQITGQVEKKKSCILCVHTAYWKNINSKFKLHYMWSCAWIPCSCFFRSCISDSCFWLISLKEAFSTSNCMGSQKNIHMLSLPLNLFPKHTHTHTVRKSSNRPHLASSSPILWSWLLFPPLSWHLGIGSVSADVRLWSACRTHINRFK